MFSQSGKFIKGDHNNKVIGIKKTRKRKVGDLGRLA